MTALNPTERRASTAVAPVRGRYLSHICGSARATVRLAVVLIASGALVAGCSSSTPTAPAPTAAPGTTTAVDPGLESLPRVAITITDADGRSTVRLDAPATVPAGLVLLDIHNGAEPGDPTGSGRGAAILGVAPGASRADLEAALVSAPEQIDELAVDLGGAAPLAPDASQAVIVSLAAGRYYVAPTGPGALGSITSSTIGATKPVVLDIGGATGTGGGPGTTPTPAPTTPRPPTAPLGTVPFGTVVPPPEPADQRELVAHVTTGEIVLSDYDVELPDDIVAGWYHVVNRGPQPHELAIVGVDDGHTGSEVTDALERRALAARTPVGTTPPGSSPTGSTSGSLPDGEAGTPPAEGTTVTTEAEVPAQLRGGLATLSPGAEAWVHLDLGRGGYVAICDRPALLADAGQSAADGLPHHTHGMAVFFRIS